MNPDTEHFEQLRKLLALKRHEQPPPRYFNDFSGQVIARIKADGQAGHGLSWARRLWSMLETKPMLTGAFGAGICALVISGVVFSEGIDQSADGIHPAGVNSPLGGGLDTLAMNHASEQAAFVSSTNPVSPALRSLLEGVQINSQTASAGFGFGGH